MSKKPSLSRARRWATVLSAGSLAATGIVVGTAEAATVSVVDYAQCANGSAPADPDTLDCSAGWINGIMQKSNSHFQESQVTPQRLEVKVPAGNHSVTLTYQTRKGGSADGTHAYDGLTTWNSTVVNANRCAGLNATARKDIGCNSGDTESVSDTATVPIDPTVVPPFTSPATGVTSTHVPPGVFTIHGPAGTALVDFAPVDLTSTPPVTHYTHSNAAGSGDDYATITVAFTTQGYTGSKNVQLLFGGHLAASPINRGGWGPGLGASNINGGPYHIKWSAADGASVGNRDNQIMGGDIAGLAEGLLTTFPSVSEYTTATPPSGGVSDRAEIIGLLSPTNSVTFSLYGPFTTRTGILSSSCVDPATGVTSNRIFTTTATLTATADGHTATSASTTAPSAVGWYQWVAVYAQDANNARVAGACGEQTEQFQVTQAAVSATSTQKVSDSVTLTGETGATPSGDVTFELWSNATCTQDLNTTGNELVFTDDATLVSGSATSDLSGSLATGTYYWKVTYTPTTGNGYLGGEVEPCGVQRVSIDNNYVAPAA